MTSVLFQQQLHSNMRHFAFHGCIIFLTLVIHCRAVSLAPQSPPPPLPAEYAPAHLFAAVHNIPSLAYAAERVRPRAAARLGSIVAEEDPHGHYRNWNGRIDRIAGDTDYALDARRLVEQQQAEERQQQEQQQQTIRNGQLPATALERREYYYQLQQQQQHQQHPDYSSATNPYDAYSTNNNNNKFNSAADRSLPPQAHFLDSSNRENIYSLNGPSGSSSSYNNNNNRKDNNNYNRNYANTLQQSHRLPDTDYYPPPNRQLLPESYYQQPDPSWTAPSSIPVPPFRVVSPFLRGNALPPPPPPLSPYAPAYRGGLYPEPVGSAVGTGIPPGYGIARSSRFDYDDYTNRFAPLFENYLRKHPRRLEPKY